MFAYYLKTALRSIVNRRLYSAVSIIGLAVGMTVSILIFSFVRYEAGYDSMHPESERTYRLNWFSGTDSRFATFFNPVSEMLATSMLEIESFTRLGMRQELFTIDGNSQYRQLSMVDEAFFDLFDYEELEGDPSDAIRDMGSAVITEAAALNMFGEARPLGRTFTINGAQDFRVAAIVGNNPGNSHLISNIFVNIENLPVVWNFADFWSNTGSDVLYHYVRLDTNADVEAVTRNAQTYMDGLFNQGAGVNAAVRAMSIALQPLREIHFTTDLQNEMSTRDDVLGTVKALRQRSDTLIFAGVAVLTLLIAAFNFMNLQVAQLAKRTKEVGVRRIAGSSRSELALQFLTETAVIALFAAVLALILCDMLMPWFNTMVATSVGGYTVYSAENLVLLIVMALALGVVAGLYPVITMTRLSPSDALRGRIMKGVSASRFRSGLIVLQFSISIGLIAASGIVSTQINYAMSKSLGFVPDNVITVELRNAQARGAYETMRDELLRNPAIVSVSAGSIIPTQDLSDGMGLTIVGGDPATPLLTRTVGVSDDYFDALGMQLVAGRAPSSEFPTDEMEFFSPLTPAVDGAIVLNEAAVRAGGWSSPEEAIGARMYQEGAFRGINFRMDATVVGVVQDAHYQSIRTEIQPVSFTLNSNRNVMLVRFSSGNAEDAVAAVDRVWQQSINGLPIQRAFLADNYSAFYSGENRTFVLFTGLTAVAMLIACFGLYAVATFIAERRAREISIRKVLGATVRALATMLAWDFSRLVIVANLIAWPLAWWAMQQWLQNFAYRTDISIGIFIIAGLATFLMALATTFQRAYSVAVANPIQSLRCE
ncbi:MAG: ABC transporter permease [Gammaproteobacteria bacterium]|nr:ABC transporter permease [Gammaproteobacteria bacterium]MDP2347535.1 ABC transporter permease [Gammaproteobacteria bacterium]